MGNKLLNNSFTPFNNIHIYYFLLLVHANEAGNIAVIGVIFKESPNEDNPFINNLWNNVLIYYFNCIIYLFKYNSIL